MIEHVLNFFVSVKFIDKETLFVATLYQKPGNQQKGEIVFDIDRSDDITTYTVSMSEIDESLRRIGLGYKFYIDAIKKCFENGADEVRSSTNRNEMSTGTWKKIHREHCNVEKRRGYFAVTRSKPYL